MKSISLLLLIALVPLVDSLAQAPVWTNYVHRKANFPESEYLVGFMSENNINGEPEEVVLERLQGYSREQLVESILVDIQSISTLNIHNVNANTHEEFKKNSTSVSNASIVGLKTETYYDKRKDIGYAISYAKKKNVINHYSNEIAKSLNQINTLYTIIQNQIQAGNNENALKSLFETQTLLRSIEQQSTMLITLTGEYNHPAIKRDEFNQHKINIDNDLISIRNTDQFKLDDAAFFIAYSLSIQLDNTNTSIRVNNFTYEDTPMTSSFSRRLNASIEQKLIQQGFKVISQNIDNQDYYVLNGIYWDGADKLKVSTILRETASSTAIASTDCYLTKSFLDQNQISYKPQNYQEAMVSMQQFAKNEITDGGLKIDVFTNKGKDNLIFEENEEMKLFVKANRECYLRFIYHLADGSKVLLLDDYYISREYVNKAYQLPETFTCAEPFGFEILQLNAQSTPFEPLQTQEQYGYKFIIEDSEAIIQKTRGFKKSTNTEVLKAEKRLSITTMTP
ncbi:DUF4384 domain-containing protein [Reichenbachiella agariperforans]|uniref:DUF4384 domain-containing protein n=1 Tax=Reichenbachiella agariperforans TaxID=156994 RepID=UPI001C091681|nr:DUF4384 domain-containing protein [Reichenbachiella agariperforans]MBU2914060.1 DUF4384 domain-containing protein [Reichenbachiella agariperforans]